MPPKLGKRKPAVARYQTNLNLPEKTRDQIEKAARKYYKSMTDIIAMAMDQFAAKEEERKP